MACRHECVTVPRRCSRRGHTRQPLPLHTDRSRERTRCRPARKASRREAEGSETSSRPRGIAGFGATTSSTSSNCCWSCPTSFCGWTMSRTRIRPHIPGFNGAVIQIPPRPRPERPRRRAADRRRGPARPDGRGQPADAPGPSCHRQVRSRHREPPVAGAHRRSAPPRKVRQRLAGQHGGRAPPQERVPRGAGVPAHPPWADGWPGAGHEPPAAAERRWIRRARLVAVKQD